nr:Cell division cycle-associated 7-like protein [Ipomoea batatas]
MAVVSGDSGAEQAKDNKGTKQKQRNNCPGVRVVGGRIYDSRNGKTCHQIRIYYLSLGLDHAIHTDMGRRQKKFQLSRTGTVQNAEAFATVVVALVYSSINVMLRKKRGFQPTGILVHTAKATGFTSVSEMLQVKGPENIDHEKALNKKDAPTKETDASDKGAEVVSPTKRGKENIFNGSIDSNTQPLISSNIPPKQESRKMKRQEYEKAQKKQVSSEMPDEATGKDIGDGTDLDIKNENLNPVIPLPEGIGLTAVAGADLPQEDIGDALQFLEFCAAFGKVLDLKKGQGEAVLRDLVQGRATRRGKSNVTAQFLVNLLLVIEEDLGEESSTLNCTDGTDAWFKYLKELVSESLTVAKNMGLDSLNDAADGFDSLSPSIKLKLLNFVCDEVLLTAKVRNWMDDENTRCAEKAKELKVKVSAAKEEEKRLKQKLQDNIAEKIISKNGAPITVSEHDAIVSQVKRETAEAHAAVLESKGLWLKCNQKADAVRTEPIYVDSNGQVLWRLKSYSEKSEILLQEVVGTGDDASQEKWSTFDVEQKEIVEKLIDSFRHKRTRGSA